ncbi:MAG TPA: CHRD domain-containing protein, partial [Ilumatobacter sp.]|nr:CHRD domain-containing protein [Ilumatobacter sp.]
GPVVVDFGSPGATSHTGCLDVLTTLAQEIMDDPAGFYVNVHNAAFPAGALRGQLAEGPDAAGSAHFLPTPLRAYDSRIAPATKLTSGGTRTISLATGVDGADMVGIAVPPGATAAIVTLTATETDGPGFLSIFSADSAAPLTSNLNYTVAGLSIAVSTQVAVDAGGQIKVLAGAAGTHFIVDVVGYYY